MCVGDTGNGPSPKFAVPIISNAVFKIFFGKLLKNPIYAILAGEQNAALIG